MGINTVTESSHCKVYLLDRHDFITSLVLHVPYKLRGTSYAVNRNYDEGKRDMSEKSSVLIDSSV